MHGCLAQLVEHSLDVRVVRDSSSLTSTIQKSPLLVNKRGLFVNKCSIAYINLKGGDPTEKHTHEHNHLFIVVKGEAKAILNNDEVIIKKDEAFLVNGKLLHSVRSNQDEETVMIGISVR